jgi:hypothetical protein
MLGLSTFQLSALVLGWSAGALLIWWVLRRHDRSDAREQVPAPDIDRPATTRSTIDNSQHLSASEPTAKMRARVVIAAVVSILIFELALTTWLLGLPLTEMVQQVLSPSASDSGVELPFVLEPAPDSFVGRMNRYRRVWVETDRLRRDTGFVRLPDGIATITHSAIATGIRPA